MVMTQSSFAHRSPPSTVFLSPALTSPSSSSWSPPRPGPRRRRPFTALSSLHLGPEDFVELAHNKVLIAATLAGAIGQLAKPFTSGRDWRNIDIIKGVRREAGKHARLLKKLWALRHQTTQDQEDGGDLVNSTSESLPANRKMASELVSVSEDASKSQRSNTMPFSRRSAATKLPRSNVLRSSEPELTELTEEFNQLNESVGHTEAQVAVGALLGFVVSLAIHATL